MENIPSHALKSSINEADFTAAAVEISTQTVAEKTIEITTETEKTAPLLSLVENLKDEGLSNQDQARYLLPAASRWGYISKHPALMPYFRWFALAFCVNLIFLYQGLQVLANLAPSQLLTNISYMVLGNFAIAILIRQQYVINLLFAIATSVPVSWPLSIRWSMGKVYHFGGWHTGCACAGTLWFSAFMATMLYFQHTQQIILSTAVLIASSTLLLLLFLMILSALPAVRAKQHNRFEKIHRFAGWGVLGLFWLQSIMILQAQYLDQSWLDLWLNEPSLWLLTLLTFSITLPWLRLKKVAVDITKPSNHVALVKFDYGVTPFSGSSMALSRNPLLEWHSFANIPAPDTAGYRLAISRAGDWTGDLIEQCPSHVWVKGIPTAGVGNVDQLFKKVLWVATGSGIGPCLPHLLANKIPTSLVWSTRDPEKTYGKALLKEILDNQEQVLIWDTDKEGKPDMVDITYQAYCRSNAEAVIVISNKKLTYSVVHAMESRGIPAFGAIWDS